MSDIPRDTLKSLNESGRKIHGLVSSNDSNLAWVGQDGVTRIEMSMERGQCDWVPWFVVYEGDTVCAMVNGSHVSAVHYQRKDLPF